MNGLTILLWITIFIIGLIAIIAVKLHFRGEELEKDENSIIPTETIDGLISYSQKKISNSNKTSQQLTQPNIDYDNYPIEEVVEEQTNIYQAPIVENNTYDNISYESQNQVLINYENKVKKFQEPMTESQVEIMTPDNEKHELKDLFTIDELIKESKRKDSEREKEAQQINSNDEDLSEIKESIRKRKENDDIEESLIEEILADEDISELLNSTEPIAEEIEQPEETINDIINNAVKETKPEETINDIINDAAEEPAEQTIESIIETAVEEETIENTTVEEKPSETIEESVQEVLDVETEVKDSAEEAAGESSNDIAEAIEKETTIDTQSVASQKDIEEAIDNASQEIEEKEIEDLAESENITDVLLNSQEESENIIKEPVLKSPTKIEEKTDEFSEPIDDNNLYIEEEENDLDYRKDLAKITNTIKGSKLFQDVKDRLKGEPEEEIDPLADIQENYIRNVNEFEEEYDEYEPIINETHDEFGETFEPNYDEIIREENTRRLMNVKTTPEPEIAKPKVDVIKPKPSRGNLKIQIGNNDTVLKKGDEIIFRHEGETYSSQVYAINGDDISVKYRGKNITIKPSDVKKIY